MKPIAQILLGMKLGKVEEIPCLAQYTIEKETDYLKKVITGPDKEDYILHVEYQTDDPDEMVYRMHVYYALMLKIYKLPLKQFVIYIGQKKTPTMLTEFEHEKIKYSFELYKNEPPTLSGFVFLLES